MSMLKLKPVVKSDIWRTIKRTNSVTSNVLAEKRLKSWNEIPGPSRLPIIGQLPHFLPGGSLYNEPNVFEVLQTHGPIVRLNPPFMPPIIALYDEAAIEEIFRKENETPSRPGLLVFAYYRRHYSKLNPQKEILGVAVSKGDPWKHLRSVINPHMLKPDNVEKYSNRADKVARDMIKRIKFLRNENNMIPKFVNEMKMWSFESNAAIIIGRRMNCLDLNKTQDSDFPEFKLLRSTQVILELIAELDATEFLWKYLPNRKFNKVMDMLQFVENRAKYYIDLAKEDIKDPNKTDEHKSILEKIMDKDVATMMIVDLFLGGIDTVSGTVLRTMFLLATNPHVQEKLRAQQTVKERNIYIRACIKESLRLMPSTNHNSRITSKDYDILGYKIPKNTTLIFCHEQLGLSEKNYYRAKEFIPERWLIKNEDDPLYQNNAHPFAVTPFGFGIRSCIGRRMAQMQMEIFFGHLVDNFIIEWEGPPIVSKITSLVNYVKSTNFILKDVNKDSNNKL